MATYKEIHGINIEAVSSDPSNPVEGQVWYNTTSNVLKGERPTLLGSWATGGSLNTARYGAGSAAASNTAAVVFGGYPPIRDETELYNGSSWTEVNDMNQANSFVVGTGTSTAAIGFGGTEDPPVTGATEEWVAGTTTKTVGAS